MTSNWRPFKLMIFCLCSVYTTTTTKTPWFYSCLFCHVYNNYSNKHTYRPLLSVWFPWHSMRSHSHGQIHVCHLLTLTSIAPRLTSNMLWYYGNQMLRLINQMRENRLTRNSPLGSKFTNSTGASWSLSVTTFTGFPKSTILMENSLDAAAINEWLSLTAR